MFALTIIFLNNLRDIERTGDIRSYTKDLVDLYVNRDQYSFSTHVTDLDNIQNSSIHSLLSSKYHEAQMHRLNIHAEIPDPVIHNYLTDLDLAVVLGHLMNNAIDGARKAREGFISIAYFDEEDCQSFIVESTVQMKMRTFNDGISLPILGWQVLMLFKISWNVIRTLPFLSVVRIIK